MTTGDAKLAQAVADARQKYGPNMTQTQIGKFALDYAMRSVVGVTFDEPSAKRDETRAMKNMLSISGKTLAAFSKTRPAVAKLIMKTVVDAPFGSRHTPLELLEIVWPLLGDKDKMAITALHTADVKQRPKGWHFSRNAGA
jgi:hypothetical protein